jgi:hypothetical protein
MTYGELPQAPEPGILLFCFVCGAEYSACRGDYFCVDPESEVHCGNCGNPEPLKLVRKEIFYHVSKGADHDQYRS